MSGGQDLEAALRRALTRPVPASSDFDLNPGLAPPSRQLRPAGVLIGVWLRPEGARLLLTQRSSQLKHHPGQIAFPGGKVDPGDRDAVGAALREAEEEIALPRESVEVLGTLSPHETVTGFAVTPVLGLIRGDFHPRPEAGEVAEVFTVPMSHVLDQTRFRIERRRWQGVWRNYYVVPWGPYYIWGATARMLRQLAQRVAE